MTPHKHAELIKKWADGAEIQCKIGRNWEDLTHPIWGEHYEYRIKPAAPKWPETTMEGSALYSIYESSKEWVEVSLVAVANAALRHACETGQLVTKEAHEEALQKRDMLIETLRSVKRKQDTAIAELRADRLDRDFGIAEAVAHAYQHAKYTIAGPDAVDLAAIIAGVKP